MPEVKEKKQQGIDWLDPYPTQHENEWQAYATQVIDGLCYQIATTGRTVCVGKVDEYLKKRDAGQLPNLAETKQNGEKGVTKIVSSNNLPHTSIDEGIMLQKNSRGRPLKRGSVTRMTKYRRQKQGIQAELPIN